LVHVADTSTEHPRPEGPTVLPVCAEEVKVTTPRMCANKSFGMMSPVAQKMARGPSEEACDGHAKPVDPTPVSEPTSAGSPSRRINFHLEPEEFPTPPRLSTSGNHMGLVSRLFEEDEEEDDEDREEDKGEGTMQSASSVDEAEHDECSCRSGSVGDDPAGLDASPSGVARSSSAAMVVIPCGRNSVALERRGFLKAADKERRWLRRTLTNEVRVVVEMERRERFLAEEAASQEERRRQQQARIREASAKRKQLDEERFMEEQRKEAEDRRQSEEAFLRQLSDLRQQRDEEQRRQKAMQEKRCRDAEKKRQAEAEEVLRREVTERQEFEERNREIEVVDSARISVLERHRDAYVQAMREMKEAREAKAQQIAGHKEGVERAQAARKEDLDLKERQRLERLAQKRAEQQEQIMEASTSRSSRRNAARDEAERLERARRQSATVQVAEKGARVDELRTERQRLRDLRREAQAEARLAIEAVKREVERQAVSSKYSAERVQQQVEALLDSSVLPPQLQVEALTGEQSPSMAVSSSSTRASPRVASPRPRPERRSLAAPSCMWSPPRPSARSPRRTPLSPSPPQQA